LIRRLHQRHVALRLAHLRGQPHLQEASREGDVLWYCQWRGMEGGSFFFFFLAAFNT
jgi:hypothetical protein